MIFQTHLVVQGISAFVQCLAYVYLPFVLSLKSLSFMYSEIRPVLIFNQKRYVVGYGKVGELTSRYEICSTRLSLSQDSMFYIIIFRRIGKYHIQALFKNALNAKSRNALRLFQYCISAVLKGEA